jgi:hypothetical protein
MGLNQGFFFDLYLKNGLIFKLKMTAKDISMNCHYLLGGIWGVNSGGGVSWSLLDRLLDKKEFDKF